MNSHPEIQKAYGAENRRDYIAQATFGSIVSIPLQLSCLIMDHFMYGDKPGLFAMFVKVRIIVALMTLSVLIWFRNQPESCPRRLFGIIWFGGPLLMVLWMIYYVNDPFSPYYAGLNIILLAMGLISPWTYKQNLCITVFTLVMYVAIGFSMQNSPPLKFIINNTTFLFLTASFVVLGSRANARQRLHEFTLRYELDENRKSLEISNSNLEVFNNRLGEQNIALNRANREIKETEMQLVQSEKMSSLGRFSAGLMHDILNPLNYAKTGLYTLQKKSRYVPAEQREEFGQIVTDIKDGVDRVQEIIQGLRNFTHPGEQAAEAIDLSAIFNDARRFVSGGLREKNIALELNIPPQQIVWIGRNDFSVVLINLLENSIDALEHKLFKAEEKPTITVSSQIEGERIKLSIHDNGSGIDPNIIAKIFDPFFTTKDVGKGTGLGLSICFGILRGYGGTISAASDLGIFSEFTLNLPMTAEAATQSKPPYAEPLRL